MSFGHEYENEDEKTPPARRRMGLWLQGLALGASNRTEGHHRAFGEGDVVLGTDAIDGEGERGRSADLFEFATEGADVTHFSALTDLDWELNTVL